jgi:hypothetical protein
MKQNLRRILMCAVLAGLPFMHAGAYDWAPVGTGLETHSYTYTNPDHPEITHTWTYDFATTGGVYLNNDYIANVNPFPPTIDYNASVDATHSGILDIHGTLHKAYGGAQQLDAFGNPIPCSLKVNGNVILDASAANLVVTIRENVVIEPYFDVVNTVTTGAPTAEAGVSQVYFKTATGTFIQVNVEHNLEFRGKTVTRTNGEEAETIEGQDLIVTFAGAGEVIFYMTDGTYVKFNGQVDYSTPYVSVEDADYPFIDMPSHAAGGTRVFICMDQTDEADTKVLFSRVDPTVAEAQRLLIEVGPNSFITYLSTDGIGEAGHGAMDFDTGNAGTGRMVLFVRGAYEYLDGQKIKFPFNDGSIMVAGHYVRDFEAATISGLDWPSVLSPIDPQYDLTLPAGAKARMRTLASGMGATEADRRGLLAVSDVASHGKLMSDPYWDLYNIDGTGAPLGWGYDFAPTNAANKLINVRKGFILGVNGQMDIANNVFVDYAAGAINLVDPLAWHDYEEGIVPTPGLLKSRNPAAFIVDGLDTALFVDGNPSREVGGNWPVSVFTVADPYTHSDPIVANISVTDVTHTGTGILYLKASASSRYGFINNLFSKNNEALLDDPTVDWTAILALGTGIYDGYRLSTNDDTTSGGEGIHVLDVEGPLKAARDIPTNRIIGVINAASILLNYCGQEILGDGTVVNRPLLTDVLYTRYNSPTLFFNNFASFTDLIVRHSDASKKVDGIPFMNSDPGVTGGERLYFAREHIGSTMVHTQSDPDRYRLPEIRLYNSTLELQESLNASGVRFVVKDNYGTEGRIGDNKSVFKFFDHGDPLDTMLTGHGRIFLCGSVMSRMYDNTFNYATNSCSVDVFKHNAANHGDMELSATVTLSMQNGDQFHPAVQAIINGLSEPAKTAYISKQRAHHLLLFALPIKFSELNNAVIEDIIGFGHRDIDSVCNMTIGWPADTQYTQVPLDAIEGYLAPRGNSAAFPYCYPYVFPGEPIYDGSAKASFTTDLFDIDALAHLHPAVVSIDGSIICFGAFDLFGKTVATPAVTDDDSGVVFVKHGGKITITRPEGVAGFSFARTSIPYQSVFSTFIAQRIWNDYDADGTNRVCWLTGIVDLPHDQVIFDNKLYGYGVQSYNITNTMFAARRAETDGYVRLSFENTDRNITNTFYNDVSGAEEVTIGWRYKNMLPIRSQNTLPKATRSAISNTLEWLIRATESVGTPAPRPQDLLYIGPGDDVTQFHVAGATMSDPFALDVSGDGVRSISARVREFTSVASTAGTTGLGGIFHPVADHFISEGAHAVLFVEYGGRIGLGSRNWNELSNSAWNLLGKDYVTICPLGDGTVDVNNNLLVTDRQALIATEKFGNPNEKGFDAHRLTFFAEMPYEIRIPAYGELDLSSFGQGAVRQEIAFGGKVKLIFEEGSTLRLPDNPTGGLVLYFNDQSQLIFEGATQGSTFIPYTDAKNNAEATSNTAPAARDRVKILGQGQIWLNKNAKMVVNGNTFVGVETDSLTKTTALTVSIQRQGAWFIGDQNVAGGAFQIGNPTYYGSDHSITFSLVLTGPSALMHIDREGFLGLAAGVINKYGNPNGSTAVLANNPVTVGGVVQTEAVTVGATTYTCPVFTPGTDPWDGEWQVQALNNVRHIGMQLDEGTFAHNNIYNGASLLPDGSPQQPLASLMAIGPATRYVLRLNGADFTEIRGGGNIMWVPSTATATNPIFVNIWDYVGVGDTGFGVVGSTTFRTAGAVKFAPGAVCYYSLLASAPLLLDRQGANGDLGNFPYGTEGKYYWGQQTYFYNALAFKALGLPTIAAATFAFSPLQNNRMSSFGETQFTDLVGYATNQGKYSATGVNGVTYYGLQTIRSETISLEQIGVSQSFAPAIATGTLAATVGINGLAQSYAIIK